MKGFTEDPEVARLTRERDEMRALLDKFERHMAEVHVNQIMKFNKCLKLFWRTLSRRNLTVYRKSEIWSFQTQIE